jgi:hypothetical protein
MSNSGEQGRCCILNHLSWIDFEWVFDWAIHRLATTYYNVKLPITKSEFNIAEELFYSIVDTQRNLQHNILGEIINDTLDYYFTNISMIEGTEWIEYM